MLRMMLIIRDSSSWRPKLVTPALGCFWVLPLGHASVRQTGLSHETTKKKTAVARGVLTATKNYPEHPFHPEHPYNPPS
jgi:hypothetical protein